MVEITISIKGKTYTIEEAREVYQELNKLFKEKEYSPYVLYPNPPMPITPLYDTGPTCNTEETL